MGREIQKDKHLGTDRNQPGKAFRVMKRPLTSSKGPPPCLFLQENNTKPTPVSSDPLHGLSPAQSGIQKNDVSFLVQPTARIRLLHAESPSCFHIDPRVPLLVWKLLGFRFGNLSVLHLQAFRSSLRVFSVT